MQNKVKQAEAVKRWAKENPEKIRASKKRFYERNRERLNAEGRAYRAANRERLDAEKRLWEKRNPELVSMQRARKRLKDMNAGINRALQHHYQVTLVAYKEILAAQGGVCAICRKFEITKRTGRLVVDHDHATGKLRALLCHRCNCGLGYFKDNLALMHRAVAYLGGFNVQREGEDWAARVREVLAGLPASSGAEGCAESMVKTEPGRRVDAENSERDRAAQETGAMAA